MLFEKRFARATLIQNHLNISVTCSPRVLEQLSTKLFEVGSRVIAKKVQGRTQWVAPTLIPAFLAAGVAAAIARPATDPVRATPGRAFASWSIINFHLKLWRILLQVLAVVCNPKACFLCFNLQRMCQAKVSKLEMMAVSFAVSRYVHQGSRFGSFHEVSYEILARTQRALKGDGARQGPMIEEHCEPATRTIRMKIAVRARGVDIPRCDISP